MKKLPFFISAVLLGSLYWTVTPNKTVDTSSLLTTSLESDSNNNQATAIKRNYISSNEVNPSHNHSPSEGEINFNNWQELQGHNVKVAIERFWQQCKMKGHCEQWLQELAGVLSPQRHQLLAKYPEKKQELEQIMGSELLSHNLSLAEKMATIQSQYEQVWGEMANVLFASELALYQHKQEIVQLQDTLPALTREEQLQVIDNYYQEASLSEQLTSKEAQYEQALELLGNDLTDHEYNQLVTELAHVYLSPEKVVSVSQRAEQISQQKQQVKNYQQGLAQLHQQLAEARNGDKAHLTDGEWAAYQEQVLFNYRKQFFN